jgi:hypothetical protein
VARSKPASGSPSPAPWNSQRTFERAEQFIIAGDLGRARELLAGCIGGQPYHAELYLRYGRLLVALGDRREGGRYLFAAGTEDPADAPFIQLFLARTVAANWRSLRRALPAKLRGYKSLSHYPEPVSRELRRLGAPESFAAQDAAATRLPASVKAKYAAVMLFLLFAATALVIGFITIVRWLLQALRSLL